MGGTDPYYVASAWYAYSAHLTAKAAEILGKTEEASYYTGLFEEIRNAIQKEYFYGKRKMCDSDSDSEGPGIADGSDSAADEKTCGGRSGAADPGK